MAGKDLGEPDSETPRRGVSRRRVVAGAAGIVAGALAGEGLAPAAAEAAGAPTLKLGTNNTESNTTSLLNRSYSPAIEVYTTPGSPWGSSASIASPNLGVVGATGGYPVTSLASPSSAGVVGVGTSGGVPVGALGVVGLGSLGGLSSAYDAQVGVLGIGGQYGVYGLSVAEAGVLGVVGSGYVGGLSSTKHGLPPAGVQGVGVGPGVVGVGAVGYGQGLALKVVGDVSFSTSGNATLPAHSSSVFVSDSGVTSTSTILVTLTSDPYGSAVSWVERSAGHGFYVHATAAPSHAVSLSYFRIS